MSLKTRRILFILFILIFLTITPLVISYATGYKFVLGKKVLQKTGMLILDTEPEGAKIYLNEKPQQLFFKKYYKKEESFITTPAKVKNLLPGEYNVKLELDGYWDWQKKLEIKPGMSTFAEDINLFKKNLPLLLVSGVVKQLSQSPDNKNFAIITDKELSFINLETENIIKELIPDGSELSFFSWSPNNKKIIIDSTIYNLDNLSEKSSINNSTSLNIKWKNNDEIYYLPGQTNKSINNLNLTTKKIKTLATGEKIIDFIIKGDNLFFINQMGKSTNLDINEIDSTNTIRSIDLPSLSDYEFINPEHRLVNLYDKKRQILYLIDPFSHFPLKETINNVKYTYWVDENKLLYANDFEIWLAYFNSASSAQKTLLTRISGPINKILWHPSNNYVIYSADNAIHTIELDDREKHNITELIKLDNIAFPRINEEGDTLYFYAKIGNQEGLYKLTIQ
jgi:hypothetical protein